MFSQENLNPLKVLNLFKRIPDEVNNLVYTCTDFSKQPLAMQMPSMTLLLCLVSGYSAGGNVLPQWPAREPHPHQNPGPPALCQALCRL